MMKLHFLVHHVAFSKDDNDVYLTFQEENSKQIFCAGPGPTRGDQWKSDIITFAFNEITRRTINVKMYSAGNNDGNVTEGSTELASLDIPCSIIPFDHRVNAKFLMYPSERLVQQNDNLIDFTPVPKSHNSNQNPNNNLLPFQNNDNLNINSNIINCNNSVNTNFRHVSQNPMSENRNRLPKLFLMIHLSTFGQLPFVAKKGTLLKHLKDVTKKEQNKKSRGSLVSPAALPQITEQDSIPDLQMSRGKTVSHFDPKTRGLLINSHESLLSDMLV